MELKKDYIILGIFIFIILITGFILIKYIAFTEFKESKPPALLVKPAYLDQPIPKIDKIETIVDNPRFKQMIRFESFFKPVIVDKKGKSNPFAPITE